MNEAAGFYERRRERLGIQFLNEVQRTITSILAHPQSGTAVSPNIRRRIVRRFPFGVLYAIDDKKDKKIVVCWVRRTAEQGVVVENVPDAVVYLVRKAWLSRSCAVVEQRLRAPRGGCIW